MIVNDYKVKIVPLKDLSQTINEMKRVISKYKYDVSEYAFMCIKDFYRVVQNLPYVDDNEAGRKLTNNYKDEFELVKRPKYTLIEGGDCDDKTVLMASFCELNGYEYKIVTTMYDGDEDFSHVYLYVYYKNEWIPVDATASNLPFGMELKWNKIKVW